MLLIEIFPRIKMFHSLPHVLYGIKEIIIIIICFNKKLSYAT